MRLPGALRDTLLFKQAFGDRAIALAFNASVQCTQDKGKPLTPLRRLAKQWGTGRTAAQRTPERLSGLGAELKRRVHRQLYRLRHAGYGQFLHPQTMRGTTE